MVRRAHWFRSRKVPKKHRGWTFMYERRNPDIDEAFADCKGLLMPSGVLGTLTFSALSDEVLDSITAIACTLDRRKARRWIKRGYSVDISRMKPEVRRFRCLLEFNDE